MSTVYGESRVAKAVSLLVVVSSLLLAAILSITSVPAWAVTSADVDAAKKRVELAKQNAAAAHEEVDRLTAESKKDAWDFYASLPDGAGLEAITILNQNNQKAWTHKGDTQDATDLNNMRKAIEGLERCNELRRQDNLSELKVSITMMAIAQANTNHSSRYLNGHSKQFNIGENLAWNYGSPEPFVQWYDDEKLYYQWKNQKLTYDDVKNEIMPSGRAVPAESSWQTGHYLNVINSTYIYTGFAVSRYTHEDSRYPYTYGQVFASSADASNLLLDKTQPFTLNVSLNKTAMTVAEYKALLESYIAESSKPSPELIEARENLRKADLELNNASENLEMVEEAYRKAQGSNQENVVPAPGGTANPKPTTPQAPATQSPAGPSSLKKGASFTVGSLKYKVTKTGVSGKAEVQVVGSSKSKKKLSGTVKIPATVTYGKVSYRVTSIKAKAFKGYTKIKKVSLGSNLKTVGASAFQGCTKLTTVTVGKSVTTIGSGAFKSCKSLKKVTISSSKVKKIGSAAFKGVAKKAVVKAPAKKVKSYTKLLKKAGLPKTAKVKK